MANEQQHDVRVTGEKIVITMPMWQLLTAGGAMLVMVASVYLNSRDQEREIVLINDRLTGIAEQVRAVNERQFEGQKRITRVEDILAHQKKQQEDRQNGNDGH